MRTIVVVEDDPFIRMDALHLLEQAGLSVTGFDNADDALSFVYERSADVAAIFTDVQMPGHMDGLVLAEIVGRHWPTIMVLLTSGRVMPVHNLPSNVRFIPKPWAPSQIIAALKEAVD